MRVYRFGLNSDWSLDSMIGNLEAIRNDEEEIQDAARKPSKKRAAKLQMLETAIQLLTECAED